MSSGVALPVSWANVTPVGEWGSTWALRGLCLCESFFGILFNVIVLWISVTRWKSLATFKWFFTNLALADLVYAVVELGCETHLIIDLEKMHIYMEGFLVHLDYYCARLVFLWHYGGAFEVYIAPMWIFVNRYVVLCMPAGSEQRYFSTKRIILCFLVGHLVSFTAVILIGWVDPERIIYQQLRHADFRYNYTQPLDQWGWRSFYVWFSVSAFVCYSTSIWCTYKVHRKLNDVNTELADIADQATLEDNRAILRTITIQGLTPVLFFLPVAFTASLFTLGGVLHVQHHLFVNWSINLIKCNGALDGAMTLFTVKPYRRVFIGYLRRFGNLFDFKKNKVVGAASPVIALSTARRINRGP